MPHKRAKRSVRLERQEKAGYDNPPTATAASGTSSAAATTGAGKKNGTKAGLNSFGGREDTEGMSKSAWRVLNAEKMRESFNQARRENKKRGRSADDPLEDGPAAAKTKRDSAAAVKKQKTDNKMTIMPHEKLSDFNRRVEATLRADVNAAVRKSRGTDKKKRRQQAQAKEDGIMAEVVEGSKSKKAQARPVDVVEQEPIKEFAPASHARPISETIDAPPVLSRGMRKLENVNKATAKIPSHRLPIGDAMKAMIEQERQRAIETYRALKEQRLAEKQSQSKSKSGGTKT